MEVRGQMIIGIHPDYDVADLKEFAHRCPGRSMKQT
jgi:hypothetical protein